MAYINYLNFHDAETKVELYLRNFEAYFINT
jgi:hypothetical protein